MSRVLSIESGPPQGQVAAKEPLTEPGETRIALPAPPTGKPIAYNILTDISIYGGHLIPKGTRPAFVGVGVVIQGRAGRVLARYGGGVNAPTAHTAEMELEAMRQGLIVAVGLKLRGGICVCSDNPQAVRLLQQQIEGFPDHCPVALCQVLTRLSSLEVAHVPRQTVREAHLLAVEAVRRFARETGPGSAGKPTTR
jgi:hypothetical protein